MLQSLAPIPVAPSRPRLTIGTLSLARECTHHYSSVYQSYRRNIRTRVDLTVFACSTDAWRAITHSETARTFGRCLHFKHFLSYNSPISRFCPSETLRSDGSLPDESRLVATCPPPSFPRRSRPLGRNEAEGAAHNAALGRTLSWKALDLPGAHRAPRTARTARRRVPRTRLPASRRRSNSPPDDELRLKRRIPPPHFLRKRMKVPFSSAHRSRLFDELHIHRSSCVRFGACTPRSRGAREQTLSVM